MHVKKWLTYSFTPVLAASMMGGVAMASHHKKKKDAKATTTQTTQANKSSAEHKSTSAEHKSSMSAASSTSTAKASRSRVASQTPSSGEIAQAKAKGMVWVNTGSKVYHTSGRYYGTTKHGQFMTLQQAKAAGYRQSKN